MEDNTNNIKRRDMLKSMATLPVLGAFGVGVWAKDQHDDTIKSSIINNLDIKAAAPPPSGSMKGDAIRIGIVGVGIRGKQLLRALGFATTDWKTQMRENALKNPQDTRLKNLIEQENLNISIRGVCDVFDVHAEQGVDAGTVDGNTPKRYRTFEEMVASPEIDAVIIATPDHHHAPMSIMALQAGKHVYVEKCMTHKIGETFALYDAAKNSTGVFQVGHQHRQTQSFLTAQDIIKKNVLGHVSLVQANTNRNDDNGAWQYNIHKKANPQTVDWKQFIQHAPEIPYNAEHFFRWRKWWEYGTGLAGDLLTHDYDRINCILKMGIPDSVTASGGIYTHRDGRTVPDVFQAVMEYPNFTTGTSQENGKEQGMTFMYSSTLGNQFSRGTMLMGHDATLQLGRTLMVYPDARSTRYQDWLQDGLVNPKNPLYAYNPQSKGIDGVTSATASYFADKGLLWTYRGGKRVDPTHLHMREWLSCIRNGGTPSCDIERGFEEAISAHMATLSLRLGKRIEWDRQSRALKNVETEELESIGMA